MANRLTDEERRQFAETGFLCIHDALPVRTTPRPLANKVAMLGTMLSPRALARLSVGQIDLP